MSRPRVMAMRSCAGLLSLFLFVLCAASNIFAQRAGLNDPQHLQDFSVSYASAPGTGVVIFKVFSERTSVHLDRQAVVKLVNQSNQAATWTTTDDTAEGVFTNIPFGSYDAEVSAVGYLSVHKELPVMNTLRPSQIDIVLKHDPAAIKLDLSDTVMSPKARKQAKHAVSLLKSNNLIGAQKQLEQAIEVAPGSPDLNFLLGYLFFQKKDFTVAGTYLDRATNLSPRNAQALTLLGRANLERQDYPAARSALERAVLADSDNWIPHDLLADTYLREKSYDRARDEAETAISKGKSEASPAQLVLGEALVGLGRDQEAVRALNVFLQDSPRHPMAGQVHSLIAEIGDKNLNASAGAAPVLETVRIPGVDPLAAIPAPGLTMKSWQPPGVDDVTPSIVTSVECPAAQVVEESGKRVQELADDVARFAAVEDLFHQALDNYGIPVRTENRKYNYVASISEPQPGFLAVDEYRADKSSLAGYPDQIASTGFAALALVFHPHMRDNFEMSCEGLGDWRGQATWLVHFKQRDDRPNRMHSYKVGNQIHAVGLKGRAWISADKFQIVRIEAEMMNPMPAIQLLSEHQVVEYGPVPFPEEKYNALAAQERGDLFRLPQAPLLPPAQLRSLHAVFGGFGREAERAQGQARERCGRRKEPFVEQFNFAPQDSFASAARARS